MKKIAITGGTGKKTGGAFVQQIASNISTVNILFPDGIKLLVRNSNTSKASSILPNAEICVVDLSDKEHLQSVLNDVDTVVHIAGIQQSKTIVDAAIECSVRKLIFVHTTGMFSKYKAAGEDYRNIEKYVIERCSSNNIILTIVRPTLIYGNTTDQNVVTFIKMVDKLPIMPVLRGARFELQPVHYNDLGNALFSILTNEEKTKNKFYNLSGAEPIMLRDLLKTIGNELGKNVRFISFPFSFGYACAWTLYFFTGKKIDYREKVQRLCEPRVFSHEDAKNDFEYSPRTFHDGIKDEVKEYLEIKLSKKENITP